MPRGKSLPGKKVTFDVASVRLSEPGRFSPPSFPLSSDDSMLRPTGGDFHADFPLIVLIQFAYKIWPTRDETRAMVSQMPKWAQTESFTIHAKAAENATKDQYRLMMQSLLAERFNLTAHFEDREGPALAMMLEKPGKLGPNLRLHSEGPPCDPMTPGAGDAKLVFPGVCGTYAARPTKQGMWLNASRDTTMELLANYVAITADQGRPVVDQTGLPGRYDFTLEFPQETHGQVAAEQPEGPTFLEALHDQLGLKLIPTRATVRVLVIDHLEQPTEN